MNNEEMTNRLLIEFRDAAREIAQEVRGIRSFYEQQRQLQRKMLRILLIVYVSTFLVFGALIGIASIFGRVNP
jgi:hypothetical protein